MKGTSRPTAMVCPSCGRLVNYDTRECPHCGRKAHVPRAWTRSLDRFYTSGLSFAKVVETLTFDGGVMEENVSPLSLDESETLVRQLFDSSLRHVTTLRARTDQLVFGSRCVLCAQAKSHGAPRGADHRGEQLSQQLVQPRRRG